MRRLLQGLLFVYFGVGARSLQVLSEQQFGAWGSTGKTGGQAYAAAELSERAMHAILRKEKRHAGAQEPTINGSIHAEGQGDGSPNEDPTIQAEKASEDFEAAEEAAANDTAGENDDIELTGSNDTTTNETDPATVHLGNAAADEAARDNQPPANDEEEDPADVPEIKADDSNKQSSPENNKDGFAAATSVEASAVTRKRAEMASQVAASPTMANLDGDGNPGNASADGSAGDNVTSAVIASEDVVTDANATSPGTSPAQDPIDRSEGQVEAGGPN